MGSSVTVLQRCSRVQTFRGIQRLKSHLCWELIIRWAIPKSITFKSVLNINRHRSSNISIQPTSRLCQESLEINSIHWPISHRISIWDRSLITWMLIRSKIGHRHLSYLPLGTRMAKSQTCSNRTLSYKMWISAQSLSLHPKENSILDQTTIHRKPYLTSSSSVNHEQPKWPTSLPILIFR